MEVAGVVRSGQELGYAVLRDGHLEVVETGGCGAPVGADSMQREFDAVIATTNGRASAVLGQVSEPATVAPHDIDCKGMALVQQRAEENGARLTAAA
jgi:hypothetical protein